MIHWLPCTSTMLYCKRNAIRFSVPQAGLSRLRTELQGTCAWDPGISAGFETINSILVKWPNLSGRAMSEMSISYNDTSYTKYPTGINLCTLFFIVLLRITENKLGIRKSTSFFPPLFKAVKPFLTDPQWVLKNLQRKKFHIIPEQFPQLLNCPSH